MIVIRVLLSTAKKKDKKGTYRLVVRMLRYGRDNRNGPPSTGDSQIVLALA